MYRFISAKRAKIQQYFFKKLIVINCPILKKPNKSKFNFFLVQKDYINEIKKEFKMPLKFIQIAKVLNNLVSTIL